MKLPDLTPGHRHHEKQPNGMYSVYADHDTEVAECHVKEEAVAITAIPDVHEAANALMPYGDIDLDPRIPVEDQTVEVPVSLLHELRDALILAGCTHA